MKITELSEYPVSPGRLREWTPVTPTLSATSEFPRDPTPPSYNQEWHLNAITNLQDRGIRTPAWLGVGFEIPGQLDVAAFRETLHRWIERHETLRSGFRVDGADFERFTLADDVVSVADTVLGDVARSDELCERIQDRLDRATDGLQWPNYVVETVERDESTTVIVGFDHSNVDGYSVFASVHELHELYESVASGEGVGTSTAGSYVAFSHRERTSAEQVGKDHPAVARWARFVADCGGRLPRFPLDLGTPEGQLLPHTSMWEWLLDAPEAESFETVCHSSTSSFLAGVLAAAAIASYELRGGSTYRVVVPLHTRTAPEWSTSMGWYIGAGPVEIALDRAAGFHDIVGSAQESARDAMRTARIPFLRVAHFLEMDFQRYSPDVFSFISFIDMRGIPGSERWSEWNARALVRMSYGDKANLWVNRTHEGVYITSRHPDTEIARHNVARFFDRVQAVLRAVAKTGDYSMG